MGSVQSQGYVGTLGRTARVESESVDALPLV